MFPGSYPYEELAARSSGSRWNGRTTSSRARPRRARDPSRRQADPAAESELLLVVDQFEELFTLTAEETRRRFLAGLTALAADPGSPVRVLVTLRADFLDQPLLYPEFGELLRAGMVAVTAPSEDELAERSSGLRDASALATRSGSSPRSWPTSATSRVPSRCCSTR